MAREAITPAPMAAPWTVRPRMSHSMLGASVQPTEARV